MKYMILIVLMISACNLVNVENDNSIPQDGTYVETVVNDTIYLTDTVTVYNTDTLYQVQNKLTKRDSMRITRYVMCSAYQTFCD